MPPDNFGNLRQRQIDQQYGTYTSSSIPFGGTPLWRSHQERHLDALNRSREQRTWLERFTRKGEESFFQTKREQHRALTQSLERARGFHEDRLKTLYTGSYVAGGRNLASMLFLQDPYDYMVGGFDRRAREGLKASMQAGEILANVVRRRDVYDPKYGRGIAKQYQYQKMMGRYATDADSLADALGYSNLQRQRLKKSYGWTEGLLGQYQEGYMTAGERTQLEGFMAASGQMLSANTIYDYGRGGERTLAQGLTREEKLKRIALETKKRGVEASQGMEKMAKIFTVEDKKKAMEYSYLISEGFQYTLNKGDKLEKIKDIIDEVGIQFEDYVEILKKSDEVSSRMGISRTYGRAIATSGLRTFNALRTSGALTDEAVRFLGGEEQARGTVEGMRQKIGQSEYATFLSYVHKYSEDATTGRQKELAAKALKDLEGIKGPESLARLRDIALELERSRKGPDRYTGGRLRFFRHLQLNPDKIATDEDVPTKILIDEARRAFKIAGGQPDKAVEIVGDRLREFGIVLDELPDKGLKVQKVILGIVKELKGLETSLNQASIGKLRTEVTSQLSRIEDSMKGKTGDADSLRKERIGMLKRASDEIFRKTGVRISPAILGRTHNEEAINRLMDRIATKQERERLALENRTTSFETGLNFVENNETIRAALEEASDPGTVKSTRVRVAEMFSKAVGTVSPQFNKTDLDSKSKKQRDLNIKRAMLHSLEKDPNTSKFKGDLEALRKMLKTSSLKDFTLEALRLGTIIRPDDERQRIRAITRAGKLEEQIKAAEGLSPEDKGELLGSLRRVKLGAQSTHVSQELFSGFGNKFIKSARKKGYDLYGASWGLRGTTPEYEAENLAESLFEKLALSRHTKDLMVPGVKRKIIKQIAKGLSGDNRKNVAKGLAVAMSGTKRTLLIQKINRLRMNRMLSLEQKQEQLNDFISAMGLDQDLMAEGVVVKGSHFKDLLDVTKGRADYKDTRSGIFSRIIPGSRRIKLLNEIRDRAHGLGDWKEKRQSKHEVLEWLKSTVTPGSGYVRTGAQDSPRLTPIQLEKLYRVAVRSRRGSPMAADVEKVFSEASDTPGSEADTASTMGRFNRAIDILSTRFEELATKAKEAKKGVESGDRPR
jgi:hypothetical protein